MYDAINLKKSVLIVDDEPRISKVFGIKLKLCGYNVICAASGEEAIDLTRTQRPNIMLLDMVMPGMTGLDVLEKIRAFSNMPVLVFTARPEMVRPALERGANDYIIKPLDPDMLVDKIKSIIE